MPVRVVSLDNRALGLLATGTSWSLVARFERALILGRIPDGTLLSVVRNDVPDGPYTARLTRSAPRDMRVYETPPRLDLRSAARWTIERVHPDDAVGHAELARRLDLLDLLAERADGARGGWDAFIPEPDRAAFEAALANGDAGAAALVAARIAGLGPGLTPSGDDLLAGALATHAWAENAGLPAAGKSLRLAISTAAAARTTRLGGQLIWAAAAGEVATPVARVLSSIFGRVGTFPPDLAPLLAVGETSGADLLAGIRLAGRALRSRVDEGVPA